MVEQLEEELEIRAAIVVSLISVVVELLEEEDEDVELQFAVIRQCVYICISQAAISSS